MSDEQGNGAQQSAIVRIVNPPNFLKHKTKIAPGLLDEFLARADKMVASLQGEFEAGTEMRIKRVAEIAQGAWSLPATREDAVLQLRRQCHDIKGEAGTFGYPLLSDIADLFRDYLRQTPLAKQRFEAIKAYVDTFDVVWTRRIKGDGGALGRQLIESLMKVNEKGQTVS
jgi:HPt (histidine-containing phosphotransfer) domain-containing protein